MFFFIVAVELKNEFAVGQLDTIGKAVRPAIAALGGVGFTVSLLMNELAFAGQPEVADEGTLAVLLGSSISIVVAAIVVSRLAAYYKRLRLLRLEAERRVAGA